MTPPRDSILDPVIGLGTSLFFTGWEQGSSYDPRQLTVWLSCHYHTNDRLFFPAEVGGMCRIDDKIDNMG